MKNWTGRARMMTGVFALAMLPFVAAAQPGSHGMHGQGAMGGVGHGHGQARDASTDSWRASLTEDQKAEIRLSYLRMRQLKDVFDARIEVVRAGIRNIVTNEDGTEGALETAVEDLMQLEQERVLNHFRHLIEVRQLLTPQQRVSFDLAVVEGRIDPVRGEDGRMHKRGHGTERGGHR